MLAYVNEPPPSPLERRPNLPPAFDEVVRRAMAKDPSERYPSAGDLGQAALVAAGRLRRARAESIVATGEAARLPQCRVSLEHRGGRTSRLRSPFRPLRPPGGTAARCSAGEPRSRCWRFSSSACWLRSTRFPSSDARNPP